MPSAASTSTSSRLLRAKHYDGYGLPTKGFRLTKGIHHLTGAEALAYARVRKGAGETDFTRAARQQEVIVALRSSVSSGGSLFWRLPTLLDAVANTIRTDVPTARLPELAAIVDEVSSRDVVRVVIGHPLVAFGQHALRLIAGPEPRADPEGRRATLLGPRHRADPLADAEGDQGPEGDPDSRLLGRPARQPNRSRSASRSGSSPRRARLSGARKPSATAWSSQPSKRVPVAGRAEQADRLGVQPELRPRRDLGQLLERPEPARQGDEAVGQGRHLGLALVERLDHAQLGQAAVCQLAVDQPARDDTDDLAAGPQRRVGDGAHHADPTATVDDADPAFGEPGPDRRRELEMGRIAARARAAEDADPTDRHQRKPCAASRGAIRRAARARCEMACFSAGVQSPSVRPPGGSEAGSKIGS